MQIVSIGDNLHEMSKMFSGKKERKVFRYVAAENLTQSAKSEVSTHRKTKRWLLKTKFP